jgi:hypothetical protein
MSSPCLNTRINPPTNHEGLYGGIDTGIEILSSTICGHGHRRDLPEMKRHRPGGAGNKCSTTRI